MGEASVRLIDLVAAPAPYISFSSSGGALVAIAVGISILIVFIGFCIIMVLRA